MKFLFIFLALTPIAHGTDFSKPKYDMSPIKHPVRLCRLSDLGERVITNGSGLNMTQLIGTIIELQHRYLINGPLILQWHPEIFGFTVRAHTLDEIRLVLPHKFTQLDRITRYHIKEWSHLSVKEILEMFEK
jgi:hypothetical protein